MLNNTLLGTITSKSTRKVEAYPYKRMKVKQIERRRAKNKVARKARRLNRIREGSKCVKFYAKG